MTYVLGLTGSIGMGKSTTADMFASEGIPVWDADATVRKLYEPNGAAVKIVAQHYPDAMEGNAVSRAKLRGLISKNPDVLNHLQSFVHPLVAQNRAAFLAETTSSIVVLDIPLLFETGANEVCDGIVVVTAPANIQRDRVLARGEMTEAEFELILSKQMPDTEKRAKATWIVETLTLDGAAQSVREILHSIQSGLPHA